MAGFAERFIRRWHDFTVWCSRETPVIRVECINDGNSNRSKHAGLHEPLHSDREHRADLPRSGCARSRRDPHPIHPRNCWTGVWHFWRGDRDDRRLDAGSVQVTRDKVGEVQHGKCNGHRSKHAGLRQLIHAYWKYCKDFSGRCVSCCRSDSRPLYTGNRRAGIRDFRSGHGHDRRINARTVQVKQMNKGSSFPARSLFSILLLCIFLSPILVTAVQAVTLSFSPLNLDDETLLINNASGVLVGVYNTSSKGIVLAENQSYSILVQPSSSDLLQNHPDTWFANFMAYFQAHFISMLLFCFIIIVIIMAYKRR